MSDPSGATAAATVRYPDGEAPQMTELASRLRQLLHAQGLAHLVLYDRDTPKVVLDANAPPGADGSGISTTSRTHERAGRQLFYILEELEPDFAELRTGALIRTVLRVPTGAVLYYLVEPGFHLYGATSAMDRLNELDTRMAECVNGLRSAVRYSPLNYGAWFNDEEWVEKPAPDAFAAPADPAAERGPEGDAGSYAFGELTDDGRIPAEAEGTLRAALDVNGLHYIAYYTDPTSVCTADIFNHPALSGFFRVRTADQRRDKYGRMGQLLPGVTRRLNMSLRAILRGEVLQVVLDVEQGAVYFHALPDGRFLVGVTLDQSRVTEADHRIVRLGQELTDD